MSTELCNCCNLMTHPCTIPSTEARRLAKLAHHANYFAEYKYVEPQIYIYIYFFKSLSLHLPLKTESTSFTQNQLTKEMANAVLTSARQALGATLSLAVCNVFHSAHLLSSSW